MSHAIPIGEDERTKHPGAVERSEVKPEPPTPLCFVVKARGGDTCERRPVSTAGELQAQISELVNPGTRAAAVSPDVFTAASGMQARAAGGSARPLITIYGLPAMFVPVLLDSPLDIDASFVQAHAARRRYRPTGVRRRRGARAASYAHWEYPELVAGYCPKDSRFSPESPEGIVDIAHQPVVWPMSEGPKGLAAIFCRASLWVSRDVDVLFLDKPRWGEEGTLRKDRRAEKPTGSIVSASQEHRPKYGGTTGDNVAVVQWKGEEIPSLESILQDGLATTNKENGVLQLLEETAYDQWLELFEVLTPRQRIAKPGRTSLEWQIMQALERNFDMAKNIMRFHSGTETAQSFSVGPDDWGGLIQRLRTRVEIHAATCGITHKKAGKTASGIPMHEERVTYVPRHRLPEADTPSSSGSDDNQRALDRVTYLGGVLLPFSVVSGVLSMNEGFEPGQPLFWVFWVATIPLTLFTVLVIYADKLRQVEVWSEVSDSGGGSDSEDEKGSTKSGGANKVQETEKAKRRPTPGFVVSKYNRTQQPEAVTYSSGGDVVIDLGTPTAEIQEVTPESPGPFGEGRRTDSDEDQDQEVTSSDDDTAEEVGVPVTAAEARYHPGWKKEQLGWKGAAMCILKMKKPLRVLDGMPTAAREGQRDD